MRIKNTNSSHAIIMQNYEKEFEILGNKLQKYERIKSKNKRSLNRLANTKAKYNELWEKIYIPF